MLKLINGAENPIIPIDDFYIEEKYSGLDELVFDINVDDPIYPQIFEESIVVYEQPYVVKAVDGGKTTAKVKCQLDIDDLRSNMIVKYKSESGNPYTIISAALPVGWAVVDHAYITTHRTIELEAGTALDIIEKVRDTFGIVTRYNVRAKEVHLYDPDAYEPLGAFADESLNLHEVNYKGKSTDFATRLYGYGKDGLDVTSINGGKPYVDDHSYSDKIISVYWKDERYTNAENLLADMKKKLKELAVPSVSYECRVSDLAKTNPEMYGFQDFSLLQVIKLVDPKKGQAFNHQVVNYVRYPFYPEKNVVTLSTVAPTTQRSIKQIQMSIEKPTSAFREIMQAAINSATEKITGPENGHVVLHKTDDGKYDEILIMDTEFIETATKVWRWDMGGLGYSSNGYNGKYGLAITMDGEIVADYITTGTMTASHVRGGDLVLGGKYGDKLGENGQLHLKDEYGSDIVKLTAADGVWATKGEIAGWNLTSSAFYKTSSTFGSSSGMYFGDSGLSIKDKFRVNSSGSLYSTSGYIGSASNNKYPVEITTNGLIINATASNKAGVGLSEGASIYSVRAQQQILQCFQGNNDILFAAPGGTIHLGYGIGISPTEQIDVYEGMFYMPGEVYISSDRRLKHDIKYIDPQKSLDFLMGLRPAAFRYNMNHKRHRGFIAQDVEGLLTDDWSVVTPFKYGVEEKEERLALDYTEFIADIVGSIQELAKRIEKLEEDKNGN